MSIFQTPEQRPVIPKEVQLATQIKQTNTQTLFMLKMGVTSAFELVWTAPEPQAVLDQFGTSASQLFQASNAAQQLIKALDPTWVELVPPYEFTVNEDGTITIGDKL